MTSIQSTNLACKIVLLGDGGVGKTSLRKKYFGEGFEATYQMTIGADELIKNNNDELVPITLIGNKSDLRGSSDFPVSQEDAVKYTSELSEYYKIDVKYVESSALTGENVKKAFEVLIVDIFNTFQANRDSID